MRVKSIIRSALARSHRITLLFRSKVDLIIVKDTNVGKYRFNELRNDWQNPIVEISPLVAYRNMANEAIKVLSEKRSLHVEMLSIYIMCDVKYAAVSNQVKIIHFMVAEYDQ